MGIRDSIKKRLPIIGMGGNRGKVTNAPAPAPAPTVSTGPGPVASAPRRPAREVIDELVKGNPIVIFMKGSPESPMCGFSANASAILASYGKPLAYFDVFSDPEVREEVKEYSQWPTLPQVYVGGEFLGGSDILRQMHDSGELKECIDAAFAAKA